MKNKTKIPHYSVLKSNRKLAERGKIDTIKHTYTCSLTFLAWYRYSNKNGGVNIFVWA